MRSGGPKMCAAMLTVSQRGMDMEQEAHAFTVVAHG